MIYEEDSPMDQLEELPSGSDDPVMIIRCRWACTDGISEGTVRSVDYQMRSRISQATHRLQTRFDPSRVVWCKWSDENSAPKEPSYHLEIFLVPLPGYEDEASRAKQKLETALRDENVTVIARRAELSIEI